VIADNDGAGCFVIGPWRAITDRFADREIILEARGPAAAAASEAALFVDPVEDAMALLAHCRAEGQGLPEGTLMLIVAGTTPLGVAPGTSLTLAAGEIGTLTAEISA